MSSMSITEINETISQMSLLPEPSHVIYTPQLSEIKTFGPPQNICSMDDLHSIKERFFYNQYPKDREITDEDLINKMCNFILGDNVPNGQDGTEKFKDHLASYFTEPMRMTLLEKFIDNVLSKSKNCYIDYEDLNRDVYYNPRINGVPLKNGNGTKMEMRFSVIKDILMGKRAIQDKAEEMIMLHVIRENDFFDGPWISRNVRKIKDRLFLDNIEFFEQTYLDDYDNNLISSIKNGSKNLNYAIDDEFVNAIISSIPEGLSTLEQSIYIYSKLCRTFTYDPVFFYKDNVQELLSTENLSNYNAKNNNVVCHNFAYILSVVLKKIGITDIRERMSITNERFSGHSNITYLIDGMVVLADSTKTVIGGDLGTHKFSNELNGIRCEMYDEVKQREFAEAKDNVLSIVKYEDLLVELMLPTKDSVERLSMKERYCLFNQYLADADLTNLDFMSYANKLIQLLDLNINTAIMYRKDDLTNVLLKVSLSGYAEDGSRELLEYIVDSKTKEIIIGDTLDMTQKESLTTKRA